MKRKKCGHYLCTHCKGPGHQARRCPLLGNNRICCVEGCGEKYHALNKCKRHWRIQRKVARAMAEDAEGR